MSTEFSGALFIGGAIWFLCGVIAAVIASWKDRSQGGFFVLGFLFGPIGILVAVLAASGTPPAPKGTRAVVCPRCNAQQNVPTSQFQYECWQCKLVSPAVAV
ncbi:hypothetical protein [Rhodococcus sp. IEGM 1318]|uniref:hypothetical protein n=1 Tax=Rhodococcus sp. IEGM 1318 TaxID=3082226 RepID=UPI0029543B35|nr:hypothetical protein [Rhodococcus sp. IEGM 1318]MDV8008633.1 hypothetical protein [Rhodococcus sp. IEGM 1318]